MAELTKKAVIESGGDSETPAPRRAGPVDFFQQVVREAKKVTWPSWKETWLTTTMVFIMVGVLMVFFAVVDFVWQYGECLLIGCVKQ